MRWARLGLRRGLGLHRYNGKAPWVLVLGDRGSAYMSLAGSESLVGQGKARQVKSRQVKSNQGKARQGKAMGSLPACACPPGSQPH